MVHFLIVTHGPLAKALEETAELIIGTSSEITSIGFYHGDDPDELEEKIKFNIKKSVKGGHKVLVFTDLVGGTPFNRIAMVLNHLKSYIDKVECLIGVNLPMLIESLLFAQNTEDLMTIKENCLPSGKEGIQDLKVTLGLA